MKRTPSPAFFEESTRKRAAEVVAAVESSTAAEVVVAVRPASGEYRHVDYQWGLLLAFVTLAVMLYMPQEIPLDAFPVGVLLAFAVGAWLSAALPGVRRRLASRKLMESQVRMAARAAFVELGVSRTSRRTGVLVFVSTLERRVEVVPDLAVEPARRDAGWQPALDALSAAVAASESPEPFFEALRQLKAPLARTLPRREDDVNELPDMPGAAA
jgi:putative membrane protein